MLSYLDAQTGSMIVAAFAGGAAGVFLLMRMYWNRFLGLFSSSRRARADEDASALLGAADADADE